MSSPISGVGSSSGTTTQQSVSAAIDPLANEQAFLQLLVAQMKNQDPMNPTDGEQYLSQLTSFAQLEQQMSINTNTGKIVTDLTPATSSSSSGTTSNTSSTKSTTNA
jgi:flagellar basal-body rod modification protein FlgD